MVGPKRRPDRSSELCKRHLHKYRSWHVCTHGTVAVAQGVLDYSASTFSAKLRRNDYCLSGLKPFIGMCFAQGESVRIGRIVLGTRDNTLTSGESIVATQVCAGAGPAVLIEPLTVSRVHCCRLRRDSTTNFRVWS